MTNKGKRGKGRVRTGVENKLTMKPSRFDRNFNLPKIPLNSPQEHKVNDKFLKCNRIAVDYKTK